MIFSRWMDVYMILTLKAYYVLLSFILEITLEVQDNNLGPFDIQKGILVDVFFFQMDRYITHIADPLLCILVVIELVM